jgi:hypothetical protein
VLDLGLHGHKPEIPSTKSELSNKFKIPNAPMIQTGTNEYGEMALDNVPILNLNI